MSRKANRRRAWAISLAILLAALVGGGVLLSRAGIDVWALVTLRTGAGPAAEDRAGAWAVPIDRPGLPNLHRVSADLYRGAQLSAEGAGELKKMGVRTVINLRVLHSDRDEIGDTGLASEHIYMKAWHPEDEDLVRFLQIVSDPARTPVFVHCQHGADRTGTMCAIYRIAVQGWTKDEAIREMKEGGFGFHEVWENLIKYIDGLDVEQIKRRAGLSPAP